MHFADLQTRRKGGSTLQRVSGMPCFKPSASTPASPLLNCRGSLSPGTACENFAGPVAPRQQVRWSVQWMAVPGSVASCGGLMACMLGDLQAAVHAELCTSVFNVDPNGRLNINLATMNALVLRLAPCWTKKRSLRGDAVTAFCSTLRVDHAEMTTKCEQCCRNLALQVAGGWRSTGITKKYPAYIETCFSPIRLFDALRGLAIPWMTAYHLPDRSFCISVREFLPNPF
jgi:hypothetical protein